VNLARCVYSRAQTLYLDDILSAVDAHTAQYLYTECICGDLVRGRTLVLVSHQVNSCLHGASYLVELSDGRNKQATSTSNIPSTYFEPSDNLSISYQGTEKGEDSVQIRPRQIYQDEAQSKGQVASNHYLLVLGAAGGLWYWLVFALLFTSTKALELGHSAWLKHWMSSDVDDLDFNLAIYSTVVSLAIFMGALRWVCLYGIGHVGFYSSATRKIHRKMLDRICQAPLHFFETTPAGRIMNIFAQDMDRLDYASADDFGSK
jgi:ABC-type multidrug transport system fused ATPase/permease subunit